MMYLIYLPLNIICMLLSYVLNPFVCLFANEVGDLPGWLRYFQTWDDSCDVDFFVKTVVPKWLRYDFDSKYISSRETTPELAAVGRDRGCVILKDGATFSIKEKIQRYLCRVLWLTRNCGYGFAFSLFGVTANGENIKVVVLKTGSKGGQLTLAYDTTKGIWNRPWRITDDRKLSDRVSMNTILGWKLCTDSGAHRSMIANRIAISID